MQQASYLEGGLLMWMLPLYLHINQTQTSNDDDDDDDDGETRGTLYIDVNILPRMKWLTIFGALKMTCQSSRV